MDVWKLLTILLLLSFLETLVKNFHHDKKKSGGKPTVLIMRRIAQDENI